MCNWPSWYRFGLKLLRHLWPYMPLVVIIKSCSCVSFVYHYQKLWISRDSESNELRNDTKELIWEAVPIEDYVRKEPLDMSYFSSLSLFPYPALSNFTTVRSFVSFEEPEIKSIVEMFYLFFFFFGNCYDSFLIKSGRTCQLIKENSASLVRAK